MTSVPMLATFHKARLNSCVIRERLSPRKTFPPARLRYQHETLNKHLKTSSQLPAKIARAVVVVVGGVLQGLWKLCKGQALCKVSWEMVTTQRACWHVMVSVA